jgi:hypothetical protein
VQLTIPSSIEVKYEWTSASTPPIREKNFTEFLIALYLETPDAVYFKLFLRRVLKLFRYSAEIKYSVLNRYQPSVIDIARSVDGNVQP